MCIKYLPSVIFLNIFPDNEYHLNEEKNNRVSDSYQEERSTIMGIVLNADEAFEMAEQIERNGAKFYRRAAGQTGDSTARQKLLKLAAMEDEHKKTFAAMRADLSEKERMETAFDPDSELTLYTRAMADKNVFDVHVDPSSILTGKETLEDILKTAIGLEKDSIAFYMGIREMIPEKLGKDRIDWIIKEEMGHIATLSEQMRMLKK